VVPADDIPMNCGADIRCTPDAMIVGTIQQTIITGSNWAILPKNRFG